MISHGSALIFLTRPISLTLLLIALFLTLLPALSAWLKKRRGATAAEATQ
jgi:TctA family transporter